MVTYGGQMCGGDGQPDGKRRRYYVAPTDFVAHRMNDQDQDEGDKRFYDEPLAGLEQRIDGGLAQTFGDSVRSDELAIKSYRECH